VGDWGPTGEYRRVNVEGTRTLLNAALQTGSLERWVQISSLGVYSGGDHYGTDETTAPNADGIDGYTLTKVESEKLVCDYVVQRQLPAVVLRPGFIYGPRDRTVMPRLMGKLRDRKFAYLGNHDKLMNNTFVGNLCEAVWLAIRNDNVVGEVFNIRDPRAVTKKEFIYDLRDCWLFNPHEGCSAAHRQISVVAYGNTGETPRSETGSAGQQRQNQISGP
jgi:nucleoside-diphosphate-sugar epimerase